MTAKILEHPHFWTRRIAIAGRGRLLRASLRALLESEPTVAVVGEAGDAEAAVAMARRLRPDIVVLDVNLPGLYWMETTRRMVAESSAEVIVLTPCWTRELAADARRAGVASIVPEDGDPAELFDAVRLRREVPKENEMVTPNVIELRRGCARGRAVVHPRPVPAVRLVMTPAVTVGSQ